MYNITKTIHVYTVTVTVYVYIVTKTIHVYSYCNGVYVYTVTLTICLILTSLKNKPFFRSQMNSTHTTITFPLVAIIMFLWKHFPTFF